MAAILVMYPWGSVKVLSRRGRCCIRHSESSFLLGSGGASDQTVASPSPPQPEDGASSISWKNGEGGEKGSKQRGRARRPRNCEKSSLRTISVRGFYFLFLYHLSILPLRPWSGAKVTLFVKDWNWKDVVRWDGDGNIGEGSSLFA